MVGRPADAEPLQRQALEQRRRILGENHPGTIASLHNYADLLRSLGRAAEGEPFARQAMEKFRSALGESHPSTLSAMNNYAGLLMALERYAEAEPICGELYEKARKAQLPGASAAICMGNYGHCLVRLGKFKEAEAPLARRIVVS